MGFDNECILNIQSLAGEYFCPVCRLLVYPDEAFQSQCTHLYCKLCLTYIVGTTRACPYDGYLVTEADSKPLIELNRGLAEAIGKIAVHCLYHRSGCPWQGPLSECTSHCSVCTFGNSPVVCNRCGVQIVHRQVQEHAQNCPGVQPQALQVESGQSGVATATMTSATAEQTHIANQSGASTSRAQRSQTGAAPTAQDPNLQANANSQSHGVAPAAVPTLEQWYQQQYQQYYQQYPGYDPYQQPYQNYYPYQQQAIQQYQQHPSHVQGQQQPQVHSQPQLQHNLQSQPQAQPTPQTQPKAQNQPQPLQHVQASVSAQPSVNPQSQLQPAVQPPTQMQSQAHPPPHGHPHLQPQPQPQPQPQSYAGVQSHLQSHPIQPHSQQHMQIPQYQQPQTQMQHPQPQIQPQSHSQVYPPHQPLPQLQPQTHLQAQPQARLPHLHPLQTPNAQPQLTHAVTGHQSFPQPQAHQQMQLGSQQPPHMHLQSGPIPQHPLQMHGQFPLQTPQIRPPQSHAPVPNQQRPVLLPPQGQVPSAPVGQALPVHPHAQQPDHPGYQRPVMQPMQQPVPQKHLQHQQSFPGQTSVVVPNQFHPHGYFLEQQQPMQSQLRPQDLPHLVQKNSHAYMSSQQSVALSHQSQNYAARPIVLNHGAPLQPFTQSPAGFAGAAQVTLKSNNQLQMSSEQQNVRCGLTLEPMVLERQGNHMPEKGVADQNHGSSQKTSQKELNGLVLTSGLGADSVEEKNLKLETDVKSMDHLQKPIGGDEDNNSQDDMHGKDTGSELLSVGNASADPAIKHMVKIEGNKLESSPGGKYVEIVAVEHKHATGIPQQGKHSTADNTSLLQAESFKERSGKWPKDAVDASLLVSSGADKGCQAFPMASTHIPDSSGRSLPPRTGRDHLQDGFQERNLSQSQSTPQGPGGDEFRSFPSHGQALGKGLMHPTHPFPPANQGRHQHMPMHYGPSTHQQRPAGATMLQSALPPGAPHHAQVPGQPPNMFIPHGPGHLPQSGQSLNPPDHFQPPVLKQPGPSSTLFEGGPSHFGPPERGFEPQSVAPQGHYNQGHVPSSHAGLPGMSQGEPLGSFNSLGGIMGRAPQHGLEGQIGPQRPINPFGSENFLEQRSGHLDGRQPYAHFHGSSARAPFGQSPGIDSNVLRRNEATGTDSSSTVGLRDERFKPLTEEGLSRFPMETVLHIDRGEFEDLKQFPRHPQLDTESAAKFGSYHSSSRLNDRGPHGLSVDAVSRPLDKAPHGLNYGGLKLDPGAGDRARLGGPDGNIGRADSTRTHPDFLGPVPGFGRHHIDQLTPRSPGREYLGFPTRDFGGLSGFPRKQSGLDDIEGRESRSFGEGPRFFNFPSDPVGNSFHDSRFPILPGQFRRGHTRMGDLAGPGNFQHHLPLGEPFGGNKSGHPRLGEPGFRSSYSLTGGMDPFDNSRKRKAASMGWCRICKVDCQTVDGLELHSHTREHQNMAVDMVLSIKQQNAKKQKTSNDHSSLERPSKSRGSGLQIRGNKP